MNKTIATYLAFALASLAVLKVGYNEYVYRSTAEKLIIDSHGKAARIACLAQSSQKSRKLAGTSWSRPRSTKLIIGNRSVDVSIWQINTPAWHARYSDPYLKIVAANRLRKVFCNYDILRRRATIANL